MKNIAILIPSLRQGGAEKQAAILATVLDKHYSVDLYLLYGDNPIAPQNQELLDKSKVRLHLLYGNIISKVLRLKNELQSNKIDILFNYLTSCDVVGAIAARMAGVERVYSGIRNARLEWHKMIADRFAHNHLATATIYNCYSGASYFSSQGFRKSKNIVIPNGFLDIATPIVREDRTIKHIVTTGRFVPQKDYHTMIRVISRLKEVRQDFVMDIIGYGVEEDNIRKWIKEQGVDEFVNIHIRPDNVQEIVRDADIYLSTSLFEGTSNSIMEALNWSLPVVATNVGDNDHLVVNKENGTLHSIGDVDDMVQSIIALLDDINLRNMYGSNGYHLLTNNYSIDAFEQRYLQLLTSR